MKERSGARPRESKSKSNGNGNGNGNGYHKLGTCPKCKRENIPLTEHHIWKRSVWGQNDRIVYLCRDCHDDLEAKVRIMEGMILRLFIFCYKGLYSEFMGQEEVNDDDILKICITGFKKVIGKIVNESIELEEGWIVRRMREKGIQLSRREQ